MARAKALIAGCALAAILAAAAAQSATITIINGNTSGVGFNDPTPVSPVGGNNGATLGAQRLNVFLEAAHIWGSLLQSNVTISVRSTFETLDCDANGGVLGAAAPMSASYNFNGAPLRTTWYHAALANRLAGHDLDPPANDGQPHEDILARFNSAVDNSSCLGGISWYYGFDHNHGNDQDLLAVVLHELAHGMGFSTLTELADGSFFQDVPDIYSHLILDESSGMHWDEMDNSERFASTTNTGHVVWDGAQVTAGVPGTLVGYRVQVNAPPSLAGDLGFEVADFGPRPTNSGITADVVLANPPEACAAIANVSGKIALIRRGNCAFVDKARAAQAAGAVAVIVSNNVSGGPPGMAGTAADVTIPVVGISQGDGISMETALQSGAVNVRIWSDPTRLAGASADGKLLLYTPNPLELGSSISHWDVSATPNLLMEPFASADLTSNVDLTLPALVDMGWQSGGGGGGEEPPIIQLEAGPNPFGGPSSSTLEFAFTVDRAASMQVEVIDARGRLVKRIFSGDVGAGKRSFTWDGTDEDGRVVDSGIFWLNAHSGKDRTSKKIALVR